MKLILTGLFGAALLTLSACGSSLPAPEPQAPLSSLILEREGHNSEFEIVHGGWQCLFHDEPPSGLTLRHVESGSAWGISPDEPWRDLEPGVYRLVVPDTVKGVVGSCARIGSNVEALIAESAALTEAMARAAADHEGGLEAAREDGRNTGYKDGHSDGYTEGHNDGQIEGHRDGLRQGRFEGRVAALAEVREEQATREPAWVHPLVNPDEPAPCEDVRKLWLRGQTSSGGDVRFALRVAVRFRDDGVAWVAVEDDAGGADACHVYSVTDWRYNSETGWLHSGPILVSGY